MTHTIVVGGGIVGSSVAYHLARDGVDTLLLDREDSGRATDAAAGVVSPATASQTAKETWYDLGLRSFEYYPELVEALEGEQDGDTGYDERGLLTVAVDDDEVEEYHESKERTFARRSPGGYLDSDTVYEVSPDEAQDLFPALARPQRALYYEDAARVDGGTFAAALQRAGETHGLAIDDADVERLTIEEGELTGVSVRDGDRYSASNVVIAGGAWSSTFAAQLDVSIPMTPVRGQVVHATPDSDTSSWPIVVSHRDKVVAPWSDDRIAVGATREEDSGFETAFTVGGVGDVIDEIERVVPGLLDAELTELRVGLRPVTADNLPVLGPVPEIEGVYLATGHGATGITLGPYSGRLVADVVRNREPPTDVAPFEVTRFDAESR